MASQALDAARALIPSWVVWVNLLWPPIATFALGSTVAYICARVALFRVTGITSALWTDRARATYPARRAVSLTYWFSTAFIVTLLAEVQNPLLRLPYAAVVALCIPAIVLGLAVANYAIAARLGDPPFRWRRWFRCFGAAWLLFPGWLILLAVILAMPNEIGLRAAIVAVVGLTIYAYPGIFGTPPLLCHLGLASPVSPRLAAAVSEASQKTGLTPAAVYEVDLWAANAFALLIPNQIAFSRRSVEILDLQQLVAVCCHEFAHLGESKRVKLIALASYFAIFPVVFVNAIFDRFGWAGISCLALLITAIFLRLRVIKRRMEGSADTAASRHELDQGVYAAALERLYSDSKIPAVLRSPGAHGHLYDRMVAAGATPNYERPAPPSRSREYAALAVGLTLVLLFSAALEQWSRNATVNRHLSETAVMYRMATGVLGTSALARLGDLRSNEGHIDQAAIFYEAAVELDDSFVYRAKLTIALSALGRCDDAVDEWTETEYLLKECSCEELADRSILRAAKSAVRSCSPLPS
jgi:Zn-dependent protease with chaperone function